MAILAGVPSSKLHSFATNFLLACGSPLSGAMRARDYQTVVSAEMPPLDLDTEDFRLQYFAAESFSKFPFPLPGVDREVVAYQKFWEAEESCKVANSRLVDWESRASLDIAMLRRAKSAIADVLGNFSWDVCEGMMSFGPGASTSVTRRESCNANKWALSSQVTMRCLPLVIALHQFWRIPLSSLEVVDGNKVTTVPKNAKTDRVIAIEPDWNMFCQRGIGTMIRHRLQTRLGLLCKTAQEENKALALEGSLTGEFATIDLRSASDSVSLALCELLLPPDWYRAMLLTRSESGLVGDKVVTYEKISSMGNGFTFELETLLFWGITKAVCGRGRIAVYGDDIICPAMFGEQVVSALVHCGFEVNTKKTFLSGPFRESCGGHYHNGGDVTPPYFKEDLVQQHQFIQAGNKVTRAASRQYGVVRDARFLPCYLMMEDEVDVQHRGPDVLGDSVLWTAFEDATPRTSRIRTVRKTWMGDLSQGDLSFPGPTPTGPYEVRALSRVP
nr:MAG: RNA-dependent RNA polymerase [Riboviria sp.]